MIYIKVVRNLSTAGLLAVLLCLFVIIPSRSAGAKSKEIICPSKYSFSSTPPTLASQPYNLYIRGNENVSSVKLYFQDFENNCELVAQGSIKSGIWSPMGSFVPKEEALGVYILGIKSGTEQLQPEIAWMPEGEAPCEIKSKCVVEFQNEKFSLQPKRISYPLDSMKMFLFSELTTEVSEVVYAVDGRPVYRSEKLQDFNYNYVPGGDHTVQRLVITNNGQKLIQSETVERGTYGDLKYYFISFFYTQEQIIRVLGLLLAIVVAVVIFVQIRTLLYRRRLWKLQHIASFESVNKRVVGPQRNLKMHDGSLQEFDIMTYLKPVIACVIIIVLLAFTNSFLLTVFTTDGVSMLPTLQNEQKLLIDRTPVSVGRFNSGGYIPKRGEVVVFEKAQDDIFSDEISAEKTYVVKRVIGLPGDKVVLKNGVITIYNKDNTYGFVPDNEGDWKDVIKPTKGLYIEITLGVDELFVAGDNRNESIDSRAYGPITAKQIVGRLIRKL